jgi:hypothetical protein
MRNQPPREETGPQPTEPASIAFDAGLNIWQGLEAGNPETGICARELCLLET